MYRTIDAAFWTDPKVRQLQPDGKMLLLYFITNPHTHVSGIYYLPRPTIGHETGLTGKGIDTLCDTLSRLGFCRFDPDREVVWVRKMMAYQGRGEKNIKSAARHVSEDLHLTPLISEFLSYYPDVKSMINDTLSHRVSKGHPTQDVGATPDQDQEQDKEPPIVPLSASNGNGAHYTQEFELFWSIYPRQKGKGDAFKAWKHVKPSKELQDQILAAVAAQKNSNDWTKDNGKYIPYPSTWLNRAQWDDAVVNRQNSQAPKVVAL